jgi:hypothetical protein
MSDDWIEVVRSDGSREMVMAEDTPNGMKQRIILILYDELYVAGDQSIEGRLEAADRIIAEIVKPIHARTNPSK